MYWDESIEKYKVGFLPLDAVHSAAYDVVQCLSVRLFICHVRILQVYCNKWTYSQTFYRLVGQPF